MNGTWWIDQNELDEYQKEAIKIPIDESAVVTGPPGSGKTNLLLLRANFLFLSGLKNIAIITFNRALREFIVSGANKYDFQTDRIFTNMSWQIELLRQFGESFDETGNFEEDRKALCKKVANIISNQSGSTTYDAILLDEAQDYLPEEINVFSSITNRLFCVADEKQKIYQGKSPIKTIQKFVDNSYDLKFHYRNGVKICALAEEVAKSKYRDLSLTETSNYPELDNPSLVESSFYGSMDEQVNAVLAKLNNQLLAYPNQPIGILCPKKKSLEKVIQIFKSSGLFNQCNILHGKNLVIKEEKPIIISTFHAAKGLEFRALHLLACDDLKSFPNNRKIIFTAITRAKTSINIYYSGSIHPYLESAIQKLLPTPEEPTLDKLFGGS